MKKIMKLVIIIIVMGGLGVGAYFGIKYFNKEDVGIIDKDKSDNQPEDTPKPKLKIVDEDSKSRPYAIMINNLNSIRKYQSGLQDAYIIYEIIVEGGITRYLALFKDQNTERIGSIRSARHYYLDYALENDAYYVHWGWSPQAQADIKSLKVNNISGLAYSNTYFYRDKSLKISSEHTGYSSIELLGKAVTKLKYRTETNADLLLNYKVDEININEKANSVVAKEISIPFSSSYKTSYTYDEINKVYKRFTSGNPHVDYVTKEQYTFKNIITYQLENKTITGGGKGRQELMNIGTGKGYYITNGYAVPITWTKESRSAQTIYRYEDGNEIDVNDGNTFIEIQPKGQKLTIS